MNEVRFVRSRKPYRSYDDFWKLVELSGFSWAWADLADLASDVLWVWPTMNMEFLGRVIATPKRRSQIAWWYLERPDANLADGADVKSAFRASVDQALEIVDAVWVSDRSLAALHPGLTYAVFGSHPGLREAEDLPKTYDVAFMGQRTHRRAVVIADLHASGLAVTPDAHGLERARLLASSRLMLSVDRTGGMALTNPIRYALAAAYGLGILQETHPDPHPLAMGRSIAMAGLGGLASLACELVASGRALELGSEAARLLCQDLTFRKGVLGAAGR
jgi:hypothetical protein